MRVLLVEDNEADALLVGDHLRQERGTGVDLHSVASLEEARRWADRYEEPVGREPLPEVERPLHLIDVVLLDLGPGKSEGMDSIEACQDIFPGVPIVVFTGLDDDSLAARALERGAQDCLPKGEVTGRLLHRVLRHAMERNRLLRIAEQRTREVEELLREADRARSEAMAILESGPGAFVVLDPGDFRILTASDPYLKVTGRNRNEVVGRSLLEAFPDDPEDPDADGVRNLRESLERVREVGEPDPMPLQRHPLPRGNGQGFEERFWRVENSPVPGSEGELLYIIHRVEDVTEHVRLHFADGGLLDRTRIPAPEERVESDLLRQAGDIQDLNRRLQTRHNELVEILEEAPSPIAVTDAQGRFLYCNPAYREMLGYSAQELGATDFPSLVHPEDRPGNQALIQELLSGDRERFVLENRHLHRDGRTVWVRIAVAPLGRKGGALDRLVGVAEDVTERREAEAGLAASKRRLSQLAEAMPNLVWGADAQGRQDFSTRSLLEYTGRPAERLRGDGWLEVVHPDDRDPCMAAWSQCEESGDSYRIHVRLRRRDGEYRWHLVQAEPVRAPDGSVERWYGAATDVQELRDVAEEARRLGSRLTSTLESITEGFILLDRDWRFHFLNRRAGAVLGHDPEELVGEVIWTRFPELVGSSAEEAASRAVREGAPRSVEYFSQELDAWFEIRAYPSEEGLGVYFRDITAEREADRRVEKVLDRLQKVAQATTDAVWDWDVETGVLWWGDGFEGFFGHSNEGVFQRIEGWHALIHPEDRDRIAATLRDALDGEAEEWEAAYRLRRADGTWARVVDRGFIQRDDAGRAVRMVGGVSDETRFLEYQARLEEQAELLDRAREGILVRDMEHRIIYWNSGAARIYGWSAEEAVGRRAPDLLKADPTVYKEAMSALLRNGEWGGEMEHRHRTGRALDVEASWSLVRDEAGEPVRILAINSDVTERKALMAQFLRSQRMESIGRLAGGIAHDLNNVLAPILLAIDLLRQESGLSSGGLELVKTMENSALRGSEMVKQVLDFARGVEGARVGIDLIRLGRDLAKMVRETFPPSIRFQDQIPKDLWRIVGDPTQVHQVLMNLFVNARDAMPNGGNLRLEAGNVELDEQYSAMSPQANPGPYVVVEVSDTGTGMPHGIQAQIFEPFFTTKDVGEGTGLGLSTVSTIVGSHGGFLDVYSEVGRGTVFRVYFPAETGAEVGGGESPPSGDRVAPPLPRGEDRRILVVEDDQAIREVTKRTLEGAGYRVTTATDGADGVAIFARDGENIDLVLTDITMPILDGPAMARALRRMDPGCRIIAASGLGTDGGVIKAKESGVRHFLSKPFTARALLELVDHVLRETPPE